MVSQHKLEHFHSTEVSTVIWDLQSVTFQTFVSDSHPELKFSVRYQASPKLLLGNESIIMGSSHLLGIVLSFAERINVFNWTPKSVFQMKAISFKYKLNMDVMLLYFQLGIWFMVFNWTLFNWTHQIVIQLDANYIKPKFFDYSL